VILQHDHPFPHLDLLMQDGDVLKAWRLLDDFRCNAWLAAEALPDHRLKFLDYEGPISGDRGTVSRLADGTFEPIAHESSTEQAFVLLDCRLATRAVYRAAAAAAAAWRFS